MPMTNYPAANTGSGYVDTNVANQGPYVHEGPRLAASTSAEATMAAIDAALAQNRTPEPRRPVTEMQDGNESQTPVSASRGFPRLVPEMRMSVSHRWEGSVLSIDDDFFEAKLTPMDGGGASVTAEIGIEDISEDDRSLLAPGAIFYIASGHVRQPGGRIMRTSVVRFRRLGRWREDEIALLRERARKMRAALGFEDDPG